MSPHIESLSVARVPSEEIRFRHEPVRLGSKAGLWLLMGTMGVLVFGILRDLIAAMLR